MPQKSIFLLVTINFCAFFCALWVYFVYQWNFVCFCYQIGILNLKLILMFMAVLSVSFSRRTPIHGVSKEVSKYVMPIAMCGFKMTTSFRWTSGFCIVLICHHGDACVTITWMSYRCVPCHPWCTHRISLVVKKTFSVFLWLWTIPLR
jgi:hypothetical protein